MCHFILLLPFFSLPVFWLWRLSLALPVYLVILLLSVWVYYYTIAAMRRKVAVGPETLLYSRGEVVSAPAGGLRVRVQSELWSASSADELKLGDSIRWWVSTGLRYV
jgi:membrane protein implicated in regulation of membrane protease activity